MKAAHPEVAAATRQNPGETLRQARESKGLSQAEVARKLNLTVSSLNNLEAGAFDKLPGHTFARGYIRAYAKLFEMEGVDLEFRSDALKSVARKALERKTGARGLRSILEGILLDTMYEIPSQKDVSKVVIDESVIDGSSKPLLIYENSEPQAKAAPDA